MHDLDRKIFGNITTREIIGATPPAAETREILDREFKLLISKLGTCTREQLLSILDKHQAAVDHVNSRPGAMALAWDKIELFNEYSSQYTRHIQTKLD